MNIYKYLHGEKLILKLALRINSPLWDLLRAQTQEFWSQGDQEGVKRSDYPSFEKWLKEITWGMGG